MNDISLTRKICEALRNADPDVGKNFVGDLFDEVQREINMDIVADIRRHCPNETYDTIFGKEL